MYYVFVIIAAYFSRSSQLSNEMKNAIPVGSFKAGTVECGVHAHITSYRIVSAALRISFVVLPAAFVAHNPPLPFQIYADRRWLCFMPLNSQQVLLRCEWFNGFSTSVTAIGVTN